MWTKDWRDDIWASLDRPWDLIIIGGGITGAGLLREAARLGLGVLLVEQNDFASGTSSRSSKLVHGGLRYLKQGQITLTRDSVRERERLLKTAPGLVEPLNFLFAHQIGRGAWLEKMMFRVGLSFFDLLAARWSHRYLNRTEFGMMAPRVASQKMAGAFQYADAQTDDARLVLRVLRAGVRDGGVALNYAAVTRLLRDEDGAPVSGVLLIDRESGRTAEVYARAVINATGAWADRLRGQLGSQPALRPLRGSHLVFPRWRFPLAQAVSFMHPFDGRPVFAFPWEGVTIVGTTDVDHEQDLDREPRISGEEVAYLMAVLDSYFPDLHLTLEDVAATFAGVRPVVDTGAEDPSRESRDHVIWQEDGLLTVTGGKLTTFRLIARDALHTLGRRLPELAAVDAGRDALDPPADDLPPHLPAALRRRLLGRYGVEAGRLAAAAGAGELLPIPGTTAVWAELRWAARVEGVVHLSDLLLRRVRLGLLLPRGGGDHRDRLRAICQEELGWDDGRWAAEWAAYQAEWQSCCALPPRKKIPDWRPHLASLHTETPSGPNPAWLAPLLAGLAVALSVVFWKAKRARS